MSYAVITENDESQWHDVTGVSYHFPRRYRSLLVPGTDVIYYKGVLRKRKFRDRRSSDGAHYFGTATIGQVYDDATSNKGDLFCEIREFRQFQHAVDIRHDGEFLESIPVNRKAFYWRDGVREITEDVYQRITSLATFAAVLSTVSHVVSDAEQSMPESVAAGMEGSKSLRLVSTYERDQKLREAAIRIHGTTCAVCGFNFALVYGQHGAGYIQVHHLQPLADGVGERSVDPATDMDVVCANCHTMIHRYRDRSLSVEELRQLLAHNYCTRI
jgi:putative restriction endonuclease